MGHTQQNTRIIHPRMRQEKKGEGKDGRRDRKSSRKEEEELILILISATGGKMYR